MQVQKRIDRPIYLHFLDRELRRVEKVAFSDDDVVIFLVCSIIISKSFSYSSSSLILESNDLFPNSIELLLELEKFRFVRLLSNEFSFEEFLESRQAIYSHKSTRYPMYFTEAKSNLWPSDPFILRDSTTQNLRSNLLNWISNSMSIQFLTKNDLDPSILEDYLEKLVKETDKAVTLDLFFQNDNMVPPKNVRTTGRLISYFYTKRYIDVFDGDILTNLPGLKFYDQLSKSDITNIRLVHGCLNTCQLIDFVKSTKGINIVRLVQLLTHKQFSNFQIEFISTVAGLTALVQSATYYDENIILKKFQLAYTRSDILSKSSIDNYISSTIVELASVAGRLSYEHEKFATAYENVKHSMCSNRKVLIVTATELEAESFLSVMNERGYTPKADGFEKLTFWRIGIIGNCEIQMIKLGDMGSSKISGSTLVIYDAIKLIKPEFIIMIGIAFGLKPKNQEIGNILMSRELQNYEAAKVMEDGYLPRAHKIPSGPTLFNRFDNAALSYLGSKVQRGFIISGDKLVDSKPFVEKLCELFPEAIGGEMEGTGLQSSCEREKTEWILIKGICDWGFDKQHENKDHDQKVAITNVCDFLIYTMDLIQF